MEKKKKIHFVKQLIKQEAKLLLGGEDTLWLRFASDWTLAHSPTQSPCFH